MYLYVNLFNEKVLDRKKYYLSGDLLAPTINSFEKFKDLETSKIKGCIGFMMAKEHSNKGVYLLEIDNLVANEKELSFEFSIQDIMQQTNEQIRKNLYRVAAIKDWLDDKKYSPNAYILDKSTFDLVRKGQINKTKQSSYTSQIQEYKSNYNWKSIVELFEPIDSIGEGHELWNNVNDLYEIGFACSKLGEPKNEKAKDRTHLKEVAQYRGHSIRLYKRCIELEPLDYRYLSALAYRYYLNVMELSKPKGRNDGNRDQEIESAIMYFEKAIALNRKSIKNNYRLGKLILEYKIKQMKYKSHTWNPEFFHELEQVEKCGIRSIVNAITEFDNLHEEQQKTYKNEYIKSCYCLGSYYLQKPDLYINEHLMAKFSGTDYKPSITQRDIEDVSNARKYLELCFVAESGNELIESLEVEYLLSNQNRWTISPMDVLYKLGVVYMYMYYIKRNFSKDIEAINQYKAIALKLMNTSYQIAFEGSKRKTIRRNTWFINDKYALLHILDDNYSEAINLLKNARDGYIMNTLCIAFLLEGKDNAYDKCLEKLKTAVENKYNLAKPISIAIMLYIYKKQGDKLNYNKLLGSADKSSRKYFECLGVS
ncbi:hypothetical protein J2Z76_001117 [Sedimentibacter acidaminivorans]|uniref:Uncharacterized protein n=1 Tax=Sedimentibacter acidaminivorans TaxID=913099 RepID=A0ABS4GCX9_9FIRM|nr:hypothetical protein [Sedimentibacter acidaminivorans]MBP1925260.1 hypothetical protein [Sedimentibacter acidaminivorans]